MQKKKNYRKCIYLSGERKCWPLCSRSFIL